MPTKIASAKKLIINKLTQAQYDSIPEKDPAQLYLITDAEVSGGASGLTREEADEFYISKDESGAAVFDMISRTQGQITVPNKAGTLALIEDLPDTSTLATKEELSSKIPAMPTNDGVYTLYCTVVNGVPVCEWKTVG